MTVHLQHCAEALTTTIICAFLAPTPPFYSCPSYTAVSATEALYMAEALPDTDVFMVFHSTALNPDTGLVADYEELSQSSEGHLWKESFIQVVGCMLQNLGPDSAIPVGCDVLLVTRYEDIPKD